MYAPEHHPLIFCYRSLISDAIVFETRRTAAALIRGFQPRNNTAAPTALPERSCGVDTLWIGLISRASTGRVYKGLIGDLCEAAADPPP